MPPQTKEEKYAELRAEFPEADEYTVGHIWNADMNAEAVPNLRRDFELMACTYLWTRLVVFWNGEVALCCHDFNNFHRIGDVSRSTIKEIWLGTKMMALRRAHLAGRRENVPVRGNCDECVRRRQEPVAWARTLHIHKTAA